MDPSPVSTAPRKRPERPLVEKFAFVLGRIRAIGLEVHPTSRLAIERNLFFDDQGRPLVIEPAHPQFDQALEALRDFTLFEFIMDNWPFEPADKEASRRLKEALKDAVDPHAARFRTPGRDSQLELFVAAALKRAGLPVKLRSPDVRTRIDGRGFDVEAKRPKSGDAIEEAVRVGAGQIRDSGCPGALFIDVTRAFNPTKGLVTRIMPDEEFSQRHAEALRGGIKTLERRLIHLLERKPVACVFFQDHELRQVSGGWILGSICMKFDNPSAPEWLARMGRLVDRSLGHAWTGVS